MVISIIGDLDGGRSPLLVNGGDAWRKATVFKIFILPTQLLIQDFGFLLLLPLEVFLVELAAVFDFDLFLVDQILRFLLAFNRLFFHFT